jgi:hypothetical protein
MQHPPYHEIDPAPVESRFRQVDPPRYVMSRQMPEHVAFDLADPAHSAAIGTVDFPMDELFDRLDGPQRPTDPAQPPPMALAADGLHEILFWVWRCGRTQRATPISAYRKFLALSATLRPELFDDMTLEQLGSEVGCTKASLSKSALQFTKHFGGLQFRRQHNGRDHMRSAMLQSHRKRKHNESRNPP